MKEEKRINVLSIILAVITLIQTILIALNMAYAFLGTYAANKPSNIWSQVWDGCHIGLWTVLLNIAAFIPAIVGIATHKKAPKAQFVLSIILFVLHPLTWLSMIYAVGSHF